MWSSFKFMNSFKYFCHAWKYCWKSFSRSSLPHDWFPETVLLRSLSKFPYFSKFCSLLITLVQYHFDTTIAQSYSYFYSTLMSQLLFVINSSAAFWIVTFSYSSLFASVNIVWETYAVFIVSSHKSCILSILAALVSNFSKI